MTVADSALLDVSCPNCGYSLRGLDSDRCPECGETFDPAKVRETNIPWAHRERLGRIRAFARTCWLALRHPSRLGREAARPLKYRDARHFQYVLTCVAFTPLAIAAGLLAKPIDELMTNSPIGAAAANTGVPQWNVFYDLLWCALAGLSLPIVATAAVYAFGFAMTSIQTYSFHPNHLPIERQNNAIAVGYYAAGKIVFTVGVGGIALLLSIVFDRLGNQFNYATQLAAIIGGSLIVVTVGTLMVTMLLAHHAAVVGSVPRSLLFAITLWLRWLLVFVICLGLMPAAIGFVRLFVTSVAGK